MVEKTSLIKNEKFGWMFKYPAKRIRIKSFTIDEELWVDYKPNPGSRDVAYKRHSL